MEEGKVLPIFYSSFEDVSSTPTPPIRQDIFLKSDTEKNHLIWCLIKGWRSEAWCLEMRDPQDIDKCYQCLLARKIL
jgi:hypothetical protein